MGSTNITTRFFILFMILAMSGLAGCSTAPPVESESMKDVEGLDTSIHELQTLLYGYSYYYAGQVDLTTTEIYRNSTDPQVRMAALEMYNNAVPEMTKACFNHDPLVGLMGAAIFAVQVKQYLTSGNGQDIFGPYQDLAVDTSTRMVKDILNIANEVWHEGDFEEYKTLVINLATEHPIENNRYVRGFYSVKGLKAMGQSSDLGLHSLGSMNEQMLAMTHRTNLITASLPRQINWQTAMIMEQTQAMIADITDSTLAAANSSMGPLLEFFAEQRELASRDLALEREAILEALAGERNAVVLSLSKERGEVLTAIAAERNLTMQEINTLTMAVLERVTLESRESVASSIDQVYSRTMRMMAIPFVLMVVFIALVMLWVRNTVNRILEIKSR